ESQTTSKGSQSVSKTPISSQEPLEVLRIEIEAVLEQYRPYVARKEWSRVKEYRVQFIEEASKDLSSVPTLVRRLRSLKFELMPGEKVEYNRAPASQVIDQLKRIAQNSK